jgi:hypothetical protein
LRGFFVSGSIYSVRGVDRNNQSSFLQKHLQSVLVGLIYTCRNKTLDKFEKRCGYNGQSEKFQKLLNIFRRFKMPNVQAQQAAAIKALEAAKNAVAQAESMLTLASADDEQKQQYNRRATDREPTATQSKRNTRSQRATNSQSSAGRTASPEQQQIREDIRELIQAGKLQLFTIKGLTATLEKDRIQVRNAVNYLENQNEITRFAEKINPEGQRGNREIIYTPANFEGGAVA